jgi:hypothetical protein
VTSKLTVNWACAGSSPRRSGSAITTGRTSIPATNTLVRATNGSLYDRALVNPDYKDFGPRSAWPTAYDQKTSIRAGYGISYDFFNRPGSAEEGINGPLAIFGVLNQSFTPGGPVPAGFLTTQNGLHHGDREHLQPDQLQQRLYPGQHPLALHSVLGVSIQREIAKRHRAGSRL